MKGETTAPSRPGLSGVAEIVRRHDRDRFLTVLFAPASRREPLFALYAFNYEIARIREVVREPMLGRIRLQWWREVVEAAYAGVMPRRHEVAEPLTAAIREFGLGRAGFDRLIDSRERDLDPAPPATMTGLEDYAAGSSGALVGLALEVLGAEAAAAQETAREVGIGYALAGMLRSLPFHARSGRVWIPAEISARSGLAAGPDALIRPSAALCRAVAEIAEAAAAHLRAARAQRRTVPRAAFPALLPAIVADRALARLKRVGYDPYDPALAAADPLLIWRLTAATLAGRF